MQNYGICGKILSMRKEMARLFFVGTLLATPACAPRDPNSDCYKSVGTYKGQGFGFESKDEDVSQKRQCVPKGAPAPIPNCPPDTTIFFPKGFEKGVLIPNSCKAVKIS